MSCAGRLPPALAKSFLFAGNARITIRNSETGNRFTFRVRQASEEETNAKRDFFFVSVLTGPENDADFSYLGTIGSDRIYRHGRKSRIGPDAPSAKTFAWFLDRLLHDRLPEKVEIWHDGKCGRCGRSLTVPESIAIGLGPECAGKAA